MRLRFAPRLQRSTAVGLALAAAVSSAPPATAALQLAKGRIGAGGLHPTLVGTLALGGTAGQPEAGDAMRLTYLLRGGFWVGGAEVTGVPEADAPGVGGTPNPGLALRVFPVRPNPMRRAARLDFELPVECAVRVEIFDVQGRRVRILLDERMAAGRHEAIIPAADQSGRDLPAGVYLMLLKAGSMVRRQNLVIVR